MINKLTLEQVASHWDIVKYGISQSLPPEVKNSNDNLNYVLASALMGKLDVWASYEKIEGKIKLNAIVTTKILVDEFTNTKNLLLFTLYGYNVLSKDEWAEGIKGLASYAKSLGCKNVIAYSNLQRVIDQALKLGAIATTELVFDVNEIVKNLNKLGE